MDNNSATAPPMKTTRVMVLRATILLGVMQIKLIMVIIQQELFRDVIRILLAIRIMSQLRN